MFTNWIQPYNNHTDQETARSQYQHPRSPVILSSASISLSRVIAVTWGYILNLLVVKEFIRSEFEIFSVGVCAHACVHANISPFQFFIGLGLRGAVSIFIKRSIKLFKARHFLDIILSFSPSTLTRIAHTPVFRGSSWKEFLFCAPPLCMHSTGWVFCYIMYLKADLRNVTPSKIIYK